MSKISDDGDPTTEPVNAPYLCSICNTWHEKIEFIRTTETEIEGVYREYYRPLLAFVRGRVRQYGMPDSEIDCEGVVQDAFLVMVRSWDDALEPRGWLFAVAKNLIHKELKSPKRAPRDCVIYSSDISDLMTKEELWWTSVVPSPTVEQASSVTWVFEVMEKLPEYQRVATYLFHVVGLKHREIVELLGCKPADIGQHIRRGTEKVRKDPHTTPAAGAPIERATNKEDTISDSRSDHTPQRRHWGVPAYVAEIALLATAIAYLVDPDIGGAALITGAVIALAALLARITPKLAAWWPLRRKNAAKPAHPPSEAELETPGRQHEDIPEDPASTVFVGQDRTTSPVEETRDADTAN
ncbi:RNA polymerase sigma factor [Nocardiopsis sp. LOL_012]|uniref:RNA polymerase sigma factor n=1 Tax=Nocardiopsis sp. LOL_012 TaxID=3345409 RepID=UPI003A8A9C12